MKELIETVEKEIKSKYSMISYCEKEILRNEEAIARYASEAKELQSQLDDAKGLIETK